MNSDHLDQVADALIISRLRLRYALPAWCGFLTTDLRNRIEGLLKRLKRSGYLEEHIRFSNLCTGVCRELSLNMPRSYHFLSHPLPAYMLLDALRSRGHNFILPESLSSLHKRSFIVSCIYEFV